MPFCPKCKYEYREGFTECSDCKVPLVDHLEEEPEVETMFNYDISDEERAMVAAAMHQETSEMYVDSSERAENYKSGAIVLIFMGIIGIIALILINLGVINLPVPASTIRLINIVMGFMFIVFIYLGFSSIGSYKRLKAVADEEDDLEAKIDAWASNINIELLKEDESDDDGEEIKFFNRMERLKEMLTNEFPDLEPSFRDHVLEDIYDSMFGEDENNNN